MRKFNVTVNGLVYEVEVEEVGASAPVAAPAAAPVAAPAPVAAAPAAAPAPKAAPAASGKAGSVAIKAPMPGTILKINAKVGDTVKKGDVVCVLEAMKMENDICAPEDGVVASVEVAQGASVATDAVLITLG
ncbi:MAG: biotin/lipoyl-binding protein [Ruminococcaceae bacterium]|nr:biotin/lipoyl-binding protein [Oscillospiraceae bacterium]